MRRIAPRANGKELSGKDENICLTIMSKKKSDNQKKQQEWKGVYSKYNWAVYCGDAKSVLESIPDESVNCVVTSPPYFWLRDYKVKNQIGLEDTVEGYVDAINAVMEETYRILAPTGLLFLNLGDTYYSGKGRSHGTDPKSSKRRFGLRAVDKSGGLDVNAKPKSILGIPWRVAMRMSENGWVLRSPIVWHRKHCLPESVKDRPRRSYEYVFMFAKQRQYFFDRQALVDADIEDMWSISAKSGTTNGLHTAPFPEQLVKRCLEIGCPKEGTVLDPFAGSGTTMQVALQTGRNAIGVDLNKEFCEYMVKRIKEM